MIFTCFNIKTSLSKQLKIATYNKEVHHTKKYNSYNVLSYLQKIKNRVRNSYPVRGVASNYLVAGPIIASIVPAATAVPITPATFGPIACMSRKLEGLAF